MCAESRRSRFELCQVGAVGAGFELVLYAPEGVSALTFTSPATFIVDLVALSARGKKTFDECVWRVVKAARKALRGGGGMEWKPVRTRHLVAVGTNALAYCTRIELALLCAHGPGTYQANSAHR